ncbi:MAG: polyprenyl diphosphate synthase [Patescibacteria group bacterium]
MKTKTTIPEHLGIILDGNRRWAQERGLSPFEGHKKGLERVKQAVKWCGERGVKILTLFVFSTENWKRPAKEINYIMKLALWAVRDYLEELKKADIQLRIIGDRQKCAKALQDEITRAENATKNNKAMILNFALSYGGRAEITEAVKKIISKKIPADKITEKMIGDNLWTSDLDLIIRTGKEQRISNFLIWQAAYSELYFSPKYWPDFTETDLDAALTEYAIRKRRFGK